MPKKTLSKKDLNLLKARATARAKVNEKKYQKKAEINKAKGVDPTFLRKDGWIDYDKYLSSDAWKTKRIEKLKESDYKCERCGKREKLDVHHNSYNTLGNEEFLHLTVLCRECHLAIHEEKEAKKRNRKRKTYRQLLI